MLECAADISTCMCLSQQHHGGVLDTVGRTLFLRSAASHSLGSTGNACPAEVHGVGIKSCMAPMAPFFAAALAPVPYNRASQGSRLRAVLICVLWRECVPNHTLQCCSECCCTQATTHCGPMLIVGTMGGRMQVMMYWYLCYQTRVLQPSASRHDCTIEHGCTCCTGGVSLNGCALPWAEALLL